MVQAVLSGAQASRTRLRRGATLVSTIREILFVVTLRGRDWIDGTPLDGVSARIADAVSASLIRADNELGRRLDLPRLPGVLAGVVEGLARGDITVLDPDDAGFKDRFAKLAEAANARPQPEGSIS